MWYAMTSRGKVLDRSRWRNLVRHVMCHRDVMKWVDWNMADNNVVVRVLLKYYWKKERTPLQLSICCIEEERTVDDTTDNKWLGGSSLRTPTIKTSPFMDSINQLPTTRTWRLSAQPCPSESIIVQHLHGFRSRKPRFISHNIRHWTHFWFTIVGYCNVM